MSSNIRIVQSALRAGRKNNDEPLKVTKIIMPILNNDDWHDENQDFKKVREIIYQMSLEDETIYQKITTINVSVNNITTQSSLTRIQLGESDEAFTQKLLLRTIKRCNLSVTTYNKAKQIIVGKNVKTRKDYDILCLHDCRIPHNPQVVFKEQFVSWLDYLSIERKYYDLCTCRIKIKQLLIDKPKLKQHSINLVNICYEACLLDDKFPPYDLWKEYYDTNLSDIIVISLTKKLK